MQLGTSSQNVKRGSVMERSEYIKCIRHSSVKPEFLGRSWCGMQLYHMDWVFQDIDHAIYTCMNGDRLKPCEGCLDAVAGWICVAVHEEQTGRHPSDVSGNYPEV